MDIDFGISYLDFQLFIYVGYDKEVARLLMIPPHTSMLSWVSTHHILGVQISQPWQFSSSTLKIYIVRLSYIITISLMHRCISVFVHLCFGQMSLPSHRCSCSPRACLPWCRGVSLQMEQGSLALTTCPLSPLVGVLISLSCCVVFQVQDSHAPRGSPQCRIQAPRCCLLSRSLHANLPATESIPTTQKRCTSSTRCS